MEKKENGTTAELVRLESIHSKHPNIFPLDEFQALVKSERIRDDRNGNVFSIVVFSLGEKTRLRQKEIIIMIGEHIRSIDSVGWDGQDHVMVFLPDTKKAGAEVFGKKIIAEIAIKEDKGLVFSIYSYPESWLSNEDNQISFNDKQEMIISSEKKCIEDLFIPKIPGWKRILDVTGASALLVLTSPLLLLASAYIKLVSPGPLFFKQPRIGYKGRPFMFWKFRTMHCGSNDSIHGKHSQAFIRNGDIPMAKLDTYDPRIIPGGKIIRKCCIDELPQLWNVLKGEMSLVGPRPCIPYEAQEYLRWHTHRFDTLPGLSGLWQVSGKNKLTFKQMIRLDIAYCENMSLLGDILIILRTPIAILQMIFEAALGKLGGRGGTAGSERVQAAMR